MDSITQAALGATIAAAGFERRLGRKSLVFGAAVGTLPDLDIIARIGGEWAMLIHHRGVTHGILFALLATPSSAGWTESATLCAGFILPRGCF